MAEPKRTAVEIERIRIDGETQARSEINEDVVDEYVEALLDGATMPPVVLFDDGASMWMADGFHRYFAHRRAGLTHIEAMVTPGSRRDAVMHAVGANATHGLRRTNADKRKAISIVLADEMWRMLSDREIARMCAVSHKTVAAERRLAAGKPENGRHEEPPPTQEPKWSAPPAAASPQPAGASPAEGSAMHDMDGDVPVVSADDMRMGVSELHELTQENQCLRAIVEADDQLAEALAEIARLRDKLRRAEEVIRSLTMERNDAVQTANALRRRLAGMRAA